MLNLSFGLLKLFAEGTLPATTVQYRASAAKKDGWGEDDEIAQKLAGLGTSGQHPQNCLRDLLRLSKTMRAMDCCPEPYEIEVPGPGGKLHKMNVILPHEQAHLTVLKDGLDKYTVSDASWNADIGVGKLLRQWGAEERVEARRAIVLGLHADGVSYSSTQRVGQSKSAAVGAFNIISAEEANYRGKRPLDMVHCVIIAGP